MSALESEFELTPHLPISSSGVLFDLEEHAFARWWRLLPAIDRDEFVKMHGGDEVLARFVCALHHMEMKQDTTIEPGVIVSAYAIAARLNPMRPETRIRAAKAWRGDAVQVLWGRLHQRSAEQAKTRIMNAVAFLLERAIADATRSDDYKERTQVAGVALKFAALVEARESEDRRGVHARGQANLLNITPDSTSSEQDAPDANATTVYLRMLQNQLGPEKLKELVAKVGADSSGINVEQ